MVIEHILRWTSFTFVAFTLVRAFQVDTLMMAMVCHFTALIEINALGVVSWVLFVSGSVHKGIGLKHRKGIYFKIQIPAKTLIAASRVFTKVLASSVLDGALVYIFAN